MVAILRAPAVGSIEEVIFSRDSDAVVEAGVHLWPAPFDIELIGVVPTAGDAPTGDDLIFDVNLLGTTVFTTQANRPRIVAGSNIGATAVPDVTAVAEGETITVDTDQIGSGSAGAKVDVKLLYRKA